MGQDMRTNCLFHISIARLFFPARQCGSTKGIVFAAAVVRCLLVPWVYDPRKLTETKPYLGGLGNGVLVSGAIASATDGSSLS